MGRGWQLLVVRNLLPQGKGHVTSSCGIATQIGTTRTGRYGAGAVISLKGHFPHPANSIFFDCNKLFSTKISENHPAFYSTSPPSTPQSPDFSHLPGARQPKTSPVHSTTTRKLLEINKKQAENAFRHCLELVRKHDADNYLSILTMPKKVQPELIAVHAFNVELALIRDKVDVRGQNNTSAIYRLQFWKDALSSIYGQSATPVPRQPVAIAMCAFASNSVPSLLESLVLARQQTLGDRPFTTVFELCGYGARTAGSLIRLTAAALDGHKVSNYQEDIVKTATDIGAAYGVANLIRSTLPLLTRGVVLLPQDVMSMHNLTADKVYNKKQLEDTKHLVKDMVRVAEKQLSSGRSRGNTLPRRIRPAFAATASSADHMLRTIKKVDFDVYSPHLQRRNPLLIWGLVYKRLLGKC